MTTLDPTAAPEQPEIVFDEDDGELIHVEMTLKDDAHVAEVLSVLQYLARPGSNIVICSIKEVVTGEMR